jgi:acyl-CoA reductase-like NAD-dependent aldehyde dehydrogenase
MLPEAHPYWLAGRPAAPNHDLAVRDKYTGEVAARVALADGAAIREAIGAAAAAAPALAEMAAHQRRAALAHCAARLRERAGEMAALLCTEVGKPIRDARAEVSRAVDTFEIAAEESVRLHGEVLPMDRTPRGRGYLGLWRRVPVGPCSLISPFNFPLNLSAHKVAPALAAGCPFVLKPASATPLSALRLGEILAETDLPPGSFSVLPCPREGADLFSEDERVKLLSFTGSPAVGWELKRRAGRKRVVLELGGNAGVIVDQDADLGDATARIAFGAFYQSGQSCISVQRILAHESVYDELRARLVEAARGLAMGDPRDERTVLGPLIAESEAERVEAWVRSAVARGARLLCGGKRDGAFVEATLLEDVPRDEPVCAQEVFGPVAILSRFRDFEDALREVNASAYGLQAGVFTRDLHKAKRAWDVLEVGGVVVGDVPAWRADHMPYGGVKDSGSGREGVRFAMEEMTEIRLLVIRTP